MSHWQSRLSAVFFTRSWNSFAENTEQNYDDNDDDDDDGILSSEASERDPALKYVQNRRH